jgi:uncharacterized delta-60 repeat protein
MRQKSLAASMIHFFHKFSPREELNMKATQTICYNTFAGKVHSAFDAMFDLRRATLAILHILMLGHIAWPSQGYAAVGDLDSTFDSDGRETSFFDGDNDVVRSVAVQEDGKIVAAGYAIEGGVYQMALARYKADGSLDITFDGDGKATTDFGGSYSTALSVDVQNDGRIVAAGYALQSGRYKFALARFNTDGTLDITFNGDGRAITDFGGDQNYALSMAVREDGKSVVAGYVIVGGRSQFALARYNADGSLDATFDYDGKATTDFGGDTAASYSVVLQEDGKILVAGMAHKGVNQFALARHNADGSLDATFDGDGKATTNFGGNGSAAHSLAVQGDGKIVAAGCALESGVLKFSLARYDSGIN